MRMVPCECATIVCLSVDIEGSQCVIQTSDEGTIFNWEDTLADLSEVCYLCFLLEGCV